MMQSKRPRPSMVVVIDGDRLPDAGIVEGMIRLACRRANVRIRSLAVERLEFRREAEVTDAIAED